MAEPEKSSLLSGSELLQHHTSTYEVNAQFTRLVSTDDLDADRQNDLARMKDDLRRLLAQERVSKSECISEGVWENDNRRVRIIRAEGKWQAFGYEDSSGKYVDSYEALFLMEMNRLFVKWNGVVVSIEQGYSLFLGSHHSSYLTLEEYQVYSLLNRVGYFVLRYDPDRVTYQPEEMDMLSTEERCVWSNLYEMLHQPNPRETFSEKEKHSTMYDTVCKSMLQYKEHIRGPGVPLEVAFSSQTDETYEPTPKKPHLDESDCFALVDRFRRMFQRFDIIRSTTEEEYGRNDGPAPNESVLHLTFELFPSDAQGFKKSLPPLPIARILVRKSSEPMPHLRDLQRVYHSQKIPVPLMLMLVSDSLSVNCFLYDMNPLRRNIIKLPNDSLGQDTQNIASSSGYRDNNGFEMEH
ncbi:uncharacterized protein LOC125956491 [Anopheles darlingi]|uniref:uncharacterized protein LOC125956491 n=1 Tax=Anopheles darlingi TaxID=43151 RepID=UPI0020FFF5DA|nr:uncharacterized protein LOC125956491 [Anopheles darlingi]